MNVYEKIDKIFSDDLTQSRPIWVDEILFELKEIKRLTLETKQTTQKIDRHYYDFVKAFRKYMQPNIDKGIYPEVDYKNKKLGVDFKGYLYDKKDNKPLSVQEAFTVYRYLYDSKFKMI